MDETFDWEEIRLDERLRKACTSDGDLIEVKSLVESGVEINHDEQCALGYACLDNNFEIAKYLIKKGAKVKGTKVIRKACRSGNIDLIKYLVTMGADPSSGGDAPLIIACEEGCIDTVKFLVSLGADVVCHKNMAVKVASFKGHLEVVKYLVGLGADIEADDICMMGYSLQDPKDCLIVTKIADKEYLLTVWAGENHILRNYTYRMSGMDMTTDNNCGIKKVLKCEQYEVAKYIIDLVLQERKKNTLMKLFKNVLHKDLVNILTKKAKYTKQYKYYRKIGQHIPKK